MKNNISTLNDDDSHNLKQNLEACRKLLAEKDQQIQKLELLLQERKKELSCHIELSALFADANILPGYFYEKLFDITMIKDISKLSVIASVRRLYNGTIKKHKRVLAMVGKHVIVESDQPILLETDGESLGHSPFEFNIVPKSVKVIVC